MESGATIVIIISRSLSGLRWAGCPGAASAWPAFVSHVVDGGDDDDRGKKSSENHTDGVQTHCLPDGRQCYATERQPRRRHRRQQQQTINDTPVLTCSAVNLAAAAAAATPTPREQMEATGGCWRDQAAPAEAGHDKRWQK